MQQVVDYLRTHAPTHSADVLNSQLLQAGHDGQTITMAWAQVAPPAPTSVTHSVVHLDDVPWYRSTSRGILAVVVATIALAAVGVLLATTGGTSELTTEDPAVAEAVGRDLGLSKQEVAELEESIGGATFEGTLPANWTRLGDGVWRDGTTGNNVNVMSFDAPGATLDDVVPGEMAKFRATPGITLRKGPVDAELDGEPAKRIYYTMEVADGSVVDGSQWIVVARDRMYAVTATVMPGGRDGFDEIQQVVEGVRLG